MRKWCLICLTVLMLTACGVETQDEEKVKDLDFTVLDPERTPEELRNVMEEKKTELQSKARETSTNLEEVNAKLEQAKEEEARRLAAEEEAREASASGSSGSSASGGTTNTGAIDASVDEVTLMAALLDCEAHHEYNAMLAVATVIMNRVEDPRFPNTIRGVIYAKGQFEPVWTGRLESALNRGPTSLALEVTRDAVNGKRLASVADCYFFLYAPYTDRDGVVIGDNVFFRSW